jgi:hypothetical protein
MDDDLKVHLDRIDGVVERVESRMDLFEERVKGHITRSLDDLATRVIAEFHKWDCTSEMRPQRAMTDTRSLRERMLAVEERISALERGDTGGRTS